MKVSVLFLIASVLFYLTKSSVDLGPFINTDFEEVGPASTARTKFYIALKYDGVELMHKRLMEVSNPKSETYGNYLTTRDIKDQFGPNHQKLSKLLMYLNSHFNSESEIELTLTGDMIRVTAPVFRIETVFRTRLRIYRYIPKRDIRVVKTSKKMFIPDEFHSILAYVSLNVPTHSHLIHSRSQTRKRTYLLSESLEEDTRDTFSQNNQVNISGFNAEAIVRFEAYCADGSRNTVSPPCSSIAQSLLPPPLYTVTVAQYSVKRKNTNSTYTGLFNASEGYEISPESTYPLNFPLQQDRIYCTDSITQLACAGPASLVHKVNVSVTNVSINSNGTAAFRNDSESNTTSTNEIRAICVCNARVGPLPYYRQVGLRNEHASCTYHPLTLYKCMAMNSLVHRCMQIL